MGERVADCLARRAARLRLRYVVVFGSRATGHHGPHSDYDVAVKAGRRLGLIERGLIYAELEECVEPARLDLLFIDDWDVIAVWEALAKGRLVWSCGRACLAEYYEDLAKAIDLVADLEPVIALFRRELSRALSRAHREAGKG